MSRTVNHRRFLQRWAAIAASVAVVVGALLLVPGPDQEAANAVSSQSFQAGNIISDQNFFDPNALSVAQIQAFLDSEINGCTTGNCLNVLTLSTTSRAASYTAAGNLICNPYAGAASESAATVIFKVQQACSVSAKAILVTLQKEEGLVTKTAVTAATLARAMGYGCPDSAAGACDTTYYGFYNQVYLGARELRRYGTPAVAGNYQPGVKFVQYSPIVACGGTNVNILDRATAALYNYTPYQPDPAALNNIFGTGDSCSSYGNRNFWQYYTTWFGDPTVPAGTPEANLSPVVTAPKSMTVSGWAVDPDSVASAVAVSVQIDQNWYVLSANGTGADLSAQYAGAGTDHYFSGTYAEPPGNHTLCIYLVNAGGAGGQGSIGCQTIAVPSSPAPVGALTATASHGVISFSGWALRPDAPTAPVNLATQYGNTWTGYTTNEPNTDAIAAVPAAGPNQGFSGSFAAPPGDQTFCLWGTPTTGPSVQILCTTVTVPTPANAVTQIDSVTGVAGAVSVSGWAVLPDSPTVATNMAIQIGTNWYPLPANLPSTEPQATVPTAGPDQGFAGSVPLTAGSYSVCLWITEPSGVADNLGCTPVTVLPPALTQSHIDSITATASGVSVAGWAVWPDKPASSVNMAIQVNSSWYGMTANSPSTEAAAAVVGSGPNHGFTGSVALPHGTYQVCLWAGASVGAATDIGCQTVTVAAAPPTQSHIDAITGGVGSVTVSGWAIWPDKLTSPVNMAIQVGNSWTAMTADTASAEGATAVPGAGTQHGFTGAIPLAAGQYSICLWAGASAGPATSIGCQTVTVAPTPPTQAHIDSITGGTGSVSVSGWAVWPDKLTSSVNMAIQIDGSWYDMTANTASTEAATAVVGAGTSHGFSQTQPFAKGSHQVCIWAGQSGGGATDIGCQTVTVH